MTITSDDGKKVAVSRGDDAVFPVPINHNSGESGSEQTASSSEDENKSEVLFTVKDTELKRTFIKKYFQADGDTVQIELSSADTNKLDPGSYKWDVRVLYENGKVMTPMVPSPFVVLETVGDV